MNKHKIKIKELIDNKTVTLSSNNSDGSIHCITVDSASKISDKQVVVIDHFMEKTLKNIKKNPNVSLNFWTKNNNNNENGVEYEIKGKAEYLTKGDLYDKALKRCQKIGKPCKGIIKIKVHNLEEVK